MENMEKDFELEMMELTDDELKEIDGGSAEARGKGRWVAVYEALSCSSHTARFQV